MKKELGPEDIKKLQERHRIALEANRRAALERKARTHRMIQIGAVAERTLPEAKNMSVDQIQQMLILLVVTSGGSLSHQEDSCGSSPRQSAQPNASG